MLSARIVSHGAVLLGLTMAAAGVLAQAAQANNPPDGAVFTCIDDKGRRITADRPIAECTGREQRVLNRDGSLRMVLPPTLTAEERAEKEARERKAAEQRAAQAEAVRRDRNLMARYADEAAHQRAREASLDTARAALQASEKRMKTLAAERKPLDAEAEFYTGKPLPMKLRQEIDANDALTEAQRAAIATQEAELLRINRLYDSELERLRRLWAGAAPGSLGPLPTVQAGAPAGAAPKR
jgi:hypothetical protein